MEWETLGFAFIALVVVLFFVLQYRSTRPTEKRERSMWTGTSEPETVMSPPPTRHDRGRDGGEMARERPARELDIPELEVELEGSDAVLDIGAAAESLKGVKLGRHVRAKIMNHDEEKPLTPRQMYLLGLDIGPESGTFTVPFEADDEELFDEGEEYVDIDVHFTSGGGMVKIHGGQATMRLPRKGSTQAPAICTFEMLRAGTGLIEAILLKENNLIQVVQLTLNAGASGAPIVDVVSLGRPPQFAFKANGRDLTLYIRESPGSGYDLTLLGRVQAEAHIRPKANAVDDRVGKLRETLQGIVHRTHNGKSPYLDPVEKPGDEKTIPDEVNQVALAKLAREGYRLFNAIFTGDADVMLLKQRLLEAGAEGSMRIQIAAQDFFVPWGMLYLAERWDPSHVEPERFLGFRHRVEQIPLQQRLAVMDATIPSKPRLEASVYLNTDIDTEMAVDVVARQQKFWNALKSEGQAAVEVGNDAGELLGEFTGGKSQSKIIYIYGHARSEQLKVGEDPDRSSIFLAGGSKVTLGDMMDFAPPDDLLQGTPLIFLNGCESAEMTSAFYGGFMPYFVDKGARGLIGTECAVPALFAGEWARRFFEAFLAGDDTVGELFFQLRRDFYFEHNNLLGLLYALYCDGDTRVEPGIEVPAAVD